MDRMELERMMMGGGMSSEDSEESPGEEVEMNAVESGVKRGQGEEVERGMEGDPHEMYRRKIIDWSSVIGKKVEEVIQSKHKIGPVKPAKYCAENVEDLVDYGSDESGGDEHSDESSEAEERFKYANFEELSIPMDYEVTLNGHTLNVTSISIDHVGARMFTGGNDYKLHLWDLPNLDASLRSFRVLEPIESQPIKSLDFNNKGNICLVCGGNAKPRVLNREGRNELEFMKGDMYLRDQKYTKGHTGVVTSGRWHPTNHHEAVTSSLDGTVRIWDTTLNTIGVEQHLPNRDVLKCRDEKGLPTGVWKSNVFPNGSKIIAACEDGSLFVFSDKNSYSAPELTYRGPYKFEVTSLACYRDGFQFLSRCQDNTMRLYDLRRFDRPVHTWYEMPNNHSHTGICLSPDEKYILTGSSNTKNDPGCLYFIQSCDYETIAKVPLIDNKVTAVHWNEALNQIFVGAGNSIKAFYNPKISQGGVMHCVGRGVKKVTADDVDYDRPIMTPHALPMFNNNDRYKRKNMENVRTDAKISSKPEMPLVGPGKGGKIAGSTTITQHLMKTVHSIDNSRREDPVEAVLRYAKEAEENPVFVDNAYKYTQPVRILDHTTDEHEEKKLMQKFKKCPKCGLKLCHCYTDKLY